MDDASSRITARFYYINSLIFDCSRFYNIHQVVALIGLVRYYIQYSGTRLSCRQEIQESDSERSCLIHTYVPQYFPYRRTQI